MDKQEIYKKAMLHFGYDRQICKLAEESSELSAAANRLLNGLASEKELASEIADVEIMIAQFRQFSISALIDHEKAIKLQRLEGLLK